MAAVAAVAKRLSCSEMSSAGLLAHHSRLCHHLPHNDPLPGDGSVFGDALSFGDAQLFDGDDLVFGGGVPAFDDVPVPRNDVSEASFRMSRLARAVSSVPS